MPRKQQDPITPVLDYFETQPDDSIKTALSVVTNIVLRRTGKPVEPKKKKSATTRKVGPGLMSEVGG